MTQNSNVNSQFIGKDLNAGKDWGQKKKRAAEDELVGRHHQFSGHKLGQTPGDGEGQGGRCAAVHRVTKGLSHDLVTGEYHQLKRECYELFYDCKSDDLDKMGKFLENNNQIDSKTENIKNYNM